MKHRKNTFALIALAISAFAIGTTEFISVGLLPLIAEDFHVGITTAGLTVSIYALGVTIGAPVLTAITSNFSRKSLLLWIMIVFIIGNSLAAFAPNITILLIARIVSAFAHGIFMSIGSTIAADLVEKEKRASAISIMFSGLTVATVTGVPFGTFIGQHFGWRLAFIIIVIIGIIAFIANSVLIPSSTTRSVSNLSLSISVIQYVFIQGRQRRPRLRIPWIRRGWTPAGGGVWWCVWGTRRWCCVGVCGGWVGGWEG